MSALKRLFQFDRCSLEQIVESRSLDKQEQSVRIAGFRTFPRRVLTLYCRITLSVDGIIYSMRPSGHNPQGVRSSTIQTGDPFEIVFEIHTCRGSRVGMNSFIRRFQTWSDSCCANFHCIINVNGL